MNSFKWQLDAPIDAIIFDCDGTLSTLEGIDELARENGVSAPVEALTAFAMGSVGINPALYQQRLDLVRPKQAQVSALGQDYFAHQIPDVYSAIQLFQRLHKSVYIVSAGLHPAVKIFGELLNIPVSHIFSVDIQFDEQGNFLNYDQTSPLTQAQGKHDIVTQIKKHHARIAYVGDGLNDLAAYDLATRFIGFGGAYYRENIAKACQYYIAALTLAPLVPLVLTAAESATLLPNERPLFDKGLSIIQQGNVLIK